MTSVYGNDKSVRAMGSGAMLIKEGEVVDPSVDTQVEPLRSSVRWAGVIKVDKAGRYRISCEVQGGRLNVETLSFHGRSRSTGTPTDLGVSDGPLWQLPWMNCEGPGEVELLLRFRRNKEECTRRVRILWEREANASLPGFGPEPIPSRFLHVPEEEAAKTQGAELALEGRVLLQRKGCVNCHDAGKGASSVPQLVAPSLEHLGQRLDRGWVERWIRSPAKLKPGTDMPSLYATNQGDSAAVANWLTQDKPGDDGGQVATEAYVLERGRKLYHTIGCVACHGAFDKPSELFGEEHADDDAAMPAANFGDLAGKWRPRALAEFLRDPLKTHPSGRMPSLRVGKDEADALANYLVSKWGPARAATSPPQMGEVLTLSMCAACHAIEGTPRMKPSKPLAQLDLARGCLDPDDKLSPRYEFTKDERTALALGIDEVKRACGKPAPLDAARMQMEFLGCGACHARDGRGGGSDGVRAYFTTKDEKADLGNEGRIPPDLSGVGFKLTTSWMRKVIVEGARARPYLAMRMPAFGDAGKGLAEGFARCEGIEPDSDAKEPEGSTETVEAGRALMGKGALACITCHDFRNYAPVGSPGPRIDQFTERLRYEWWAAYMPDPSRYKPGTRMPSFQLGGKSTCGTILGGDLEKQIDALWSTCNLGEFMPAPEGLEQGRGLQLVVGARPIVMRTFLESVGPRAIAVGMPSGVHYAFDAEKVRLADVWRGDFLDASSSWTGRGGENAGGLGKEVWKPSPGAVFALPPSGAPLKAWPEQAGHDAELEFRGYSLDAGGVPTFEYRWKDYDITERIATEAAPSVRVVREFRWAKAPPVFLVCAGTVKHRLDARSTAFSFSKLDGGVACYELRPARPDQGLSFSLEIDP